MCAVRTVLFPLSCSLVFAVTASCDRVRDDTSTPIAENKQQPLTEVDVPLSQHNLRPTFGGTEPDSPRFRRLAPGSTGVDFVSLLDPGHPMRFLYHSGTSVGGVAIGDVDGDGRPDLFFVSGPGPNHLYRQTGDFRFEDITAAAGVGGGDLWGTGTALVDIDNDGDLDIYVCNYDAPNQLFINSGGGKFEEKGADWGIDVVGASLMPSFCDYDRDGDLDFYLLTTRHHDPKGLPEGAPILTSVGGKSVVIPSKRKYWRAQFDGRGWLAVPQRTPDQLFRNNGDGTFSDVTAAAGIASAGDGLAAIWWDHNDDGLSDLYVSNDFEAPDHLYENNGDGTFTDVICDRVPHTAWFSMGADAGDLNNDGRVDFLASDMSPTSHYMKKTTMGAMGRKKHFLETAEPRQTMRNALYVNTGTDRFMEAAYLAGVASSDWTWSIKIADLDNDGRSDIYITNGAAKNSNDSDLDIDSEKLSGAFIWDLYKNVPARKEQNLAFRNRGELEFENVSRAWGLAHVGMSYGAALSDLDRDGDLDLVVVNLDEPASIYRNDSKGNHRVLIRLVGRASNRYGIGATVRIGTGGSKQVRQVRLSSGFLACNEPLVHFGLGAAEVIDELTVNWPSGERQVFAHLAADQFYTISEPISPASHSVAIAAPVNEIAPTVPQKEPMYVPSNALPDIWLKERSFNDFARQPLLPNKLSQLGPGLAIGDVDGNGDDDLYVGGAAGETGRLFLKGSAGRYAPVEDLDQPFFKDAECEDMTPLLFDADGDGDLDLFVTSGGVECEPGEAVLRDRLYWNDGKGRFTKSEEALPDLRDSGATACAADFDRDGDLDLFVGGRVIPGEYPVAPRSRLLVNDGAGKFRDATESLAPRLGETGLVTSALWSDANDDGWLDLLVAHEWGPVKLFANESGKLVDRTSDAGLAERLGWWNAIAGRDLNGDGHMDYVVTNMGLNTKYRASPEKPALLFYGDFDDSGTKSLVEAEFEGEYLFPVRGRSCSSNAMPFIKDRFASYHDYALAKLEDIYTSKCLDESLRFACNCLESGVLLNDGTGRFEFRPLPRLAQIAPAFGVVLTDVNADGNCDLYLAGNFFGPQFQTGRMDGGVSLLLMGRGDGRFEPVWPNVSGLSVTGDAKSLVATDLNGDGWPDFIVAQNDDALVAFEHRGNVGQPLVVRLVGKQGNSAAAGARVALIFEGGSQQTAEVYAGCGYLSQSSSALYFGVPTDEVATEIRIRWPDGSMSDHGISKPNDGSPWQVLISQE